MIVRLVFALVMLFTLFDPLSAQIKTGTATLGMNAAISFQSGKIFNPERLGMSFQKGFPCSLSVDSADLFFLSHDCGTCVYYCPCEIIGSARAFYISKKSINQLGIENSLNLTDTAVFKKNESTKNCFDRGDSAACFLPSISIGKFGFLCPPYDWLQPIIVMTTQKKYVIMSFDRTFGESCSQGGTDKECNSYINSIILHWFMQTDGTTNFRGIYTSVNSSNMPQPSERNKYAKIYKIADVNNIGLFDILGRKMRNHMKKNTRPQGSANNGIFVDEKTMKIMLLFPIH